MSNQKPQFREVTIFIREGETIREFLAKAHDAFYAEAEFEKMMAEPRVTIEEVLRDLEIIHEEMLQTFVDRHKEQLDRGEMVGETLSCIGKEETIHESDDCAVREVPKS